MGPAVLNDMHHIAVLYAQQSKHDDALNMLKQVRVASNMCTIKKT
jgi:hypothetical protein